jgi:thiol:disulfide interchange protein DsbD
MTVLPISDIMPATGVVSVREDVVRRSWKVVGLGLLVGMIMSAAIACGRRHEAPPPADTTVAVTSHREVSVQWEEDWETAFSRARAEGKPVLVNFYAEWCVWCKHLESVTYRDSKVAGVLAGRVVPLNVDIDAADMDLLREHRVEAPPTVVLLDGEGHELGRIPGYMPPAGFLRALESFIGSEHPELSSLPG